MFFMKRKESFVGYWAYFSMLIYLVSFFLLIFANVTTTLLLFDCLFPEPRVAIVVKVRVNFESRFKTGIPASLYVYGQIQAKGKVLARSLVRCMSTKSELFFRQYTP